ncbi:hypothetical protein NP236_23435, partial [Salmonella enterica]|nr:hypothetical protein [Salmonella enterica]
IVDLQEDAGVVHAGSVDLASQFFDGLEVVAVVSDLRFIAEFSVEARLLTRGKGERREEG